MEVGGEDVGRIEFELRADVVPETAENFRQLVSTSVDQSVGRTVTPRGRGLQNAILVVLTFCVLFFLL